MDPLGYASEITGLDFIKDVKYSEVWYVLPVQWFVACHSLLSK